MIDTTTMRLRFAKRKKRMTYWVRRVGSGIAGDADRNVAETREVEVYPPGGEAVHALCDEIDLLRTRLNAGLQQPGAAGETDGQ
jgi:hypothetical protein